jgi:mono/diheme cytochrome c family protein
MRKLTPLFLLVPSLLSSACEGDDTVAPPPTDEVVVDSPSAQSVHTSKVRPPAISGGTLVVSADATRAVVSDPDRDRIVIVDLSNDTVIKTIDVEPGQEPGRAVIDNAGRAHVALRNSNQLLTVNIANGEVEGRFTVCSSPRGIAAFQAIENPADASLVIACATGEVVELDAATGEPIARAEFAPDLRDVVIAGPGTRAGRRVFVSSFRSADVLTLNTDLELENSSRPGGYVHSGSQRAFVSNVAWRMVPASGGALMVHQRSATVPIGDANQQVPQQYYASVDCGSSVVHGAATQFDSLGNAVPGSRGVGLAVLPVDIAVSEDKGVFAYVAAASGFVEIKSLPTEGAQPPDPCEGGLSSIRINAGPEPIAVAFAGEDVIVQTREPSTLLRYSLLSMTQEAMVGLGGDSRRDTGHQMFHSNPDGAVTISCASCHPEGGDDGHVWQFTDIGLRRTQTLQGDITQTAPFHWDGDLTDLNHLMSKVFVERMGGMEQSEDRVEALTDWLSGVPAIPGRESVDVDAVARGKAIYENDKAACASCHGGAQLTNSETVDVGTGRAFQVPSLKGIRNRAPFMHDGCAPTLLDRFEPSCGGTNHGDLSGLTDADLADLVAYLDTL